MNTTAWFHCFAGIAGDMALGSLIDAGADPDEVTSLLGRLPLTGWRVEFEQVLRGGLAATLASVSVIDDEIVRTYSNVVALIEQARLPSEVARRSLATFARLAEVEAELHRRPLGSVHFHELGGHDTIIDIVGTCAALEVLGVEQVCASPVATGLGMVKSAHGALPNPSPAVVRLLENLPTFGRDVNVELTTPTGAALISALASPPLGPIPAMVISASGFGAGRRLIDDLPNCTQVVIGTTREASPGLVPTFDGNQPVLGLQPGEDLSTGGSLQQEVCTLETNLDDVTGETLAHALQALMDGGALDAWLIPIVMKKGRPAHSLHVVCRPTDVAVVIEILARETGTLGIRIQRPTRWVSPRQSYLVDVQGCSVRVKAGPHGAKAEHEDAARAAAALGLPLREVARRAEETFRKKSPQS
ncbi:MAG: nickel pincer cofactor biosynthesis protein LarC [Acidimicrobiales bacterium]